MKRQRPVPAYKARLAECAARLSDRRHHEAEMEGHRWAAEFWSKRIEESVAKRQAEQAAQETRAKSRRPSFFHELAVALGWRRAG